ncbi:hypothetical protein Vafri_6971 [Volvox africanus]|uniref:CBF1-interacting co-repressor CIR N-terminal domain-containing protein n=1 Tax=Volvox africanus TaxID=51714 RepID=A0A8J4EWM7_9CHLO|nr:hypothetical protein Vafri_6971 [Volvox africanus]
MGGHGGLNILPQKRWNVYNRENRLKVSQDEAKAEKQEEEARRRHGQAEREHRRQLLLRRASGGDRLREEALGGGELASTAPEHINFWKEEEAKLQHPENQKQQRDELKRRGNPDFYTSDAKFDERFALGYGLLAKKPWYAQAQKPEDRADSGAGVTAGGVSATHSVPRGLAQSDATAAGEGRHSLNPQQQLLLKQAEQPEGLQGRGRRSKRDRRRGDSTDRNGASTSTGTESSRDTDTSTSGSEISSSDDSSSSTTTSSSSSGSSSSSDSDSDSDSDSSGRRSRRRKHQRSSASRERRSRRGSKHRRKRRRQNTSSSDDDSQGRGASKKRKNGHSERSNSKSGSRRKMASKSKRDYDKLLLSSAVAVGASKSIEQLRAERLQREKEERVKQRGVLASTAVLPDGIPSKSYNSAYGFAAGLKRRRA